MVLGPQQLWGEFLQRAFPCNAPPPLLRVDVQAALEMFFDAAPAFREKAKATGNLWSPVAKMEVDNMLEGIANSGNPEHVVKLSPQGWGEWWMRWSYAITALTLEAAAQSDWNIEVPRYAAEDIQGTAVLLFVMAGPARDYPPELLQNLK